MDGIFLGGNPPLAAPREFQPSPALTEAYYGGNPALARCDKLFNELASRIRSEPHFVANASAELREASSLLADLFGVQKVTIWWDYQSIQMNAYTIPIFASGGEWETTVGPNGVMYKNKLDKEIVIYMNDAILHRFPFATGRHIMAVILHEIGHNFFKSPWYTFICRFMGIITVIAAVVYGILAFVGQNPMAARTCLNALSGLLAKPMIQVVSITPPWLAKFIGVVRGLGDFITGIADVVISATIVLPLAASLSNIIQSPIQFLLGCVIMQGYENEKFADNFAASFGYGPEMAEMAKAFEMNTNMNAVSEAVSKVPILGLIVGFGSGMMLASTMIADPHPDNLQRIKNMSARLRSDLNSGGRLIGPQTRAKMMKDLDDVDALYAQATLETSSGVNGPVKWASYWVKHEVLRIPRSTSDIKEYVFGDRDYEWMAQVARK